MERKPHLAKWDIVCSDKRNSGLGVRRFLLSIGPFYVSGTGALRMKARLFGSMLLVGSLGRKKGGGVPGK